MEVDDISIENYQIVYLVIVGREFHRGSRCLELLQLLSHPTSADYTSCPTTPMEDLWVLYDSPDPPGIWPITSHSCTGEQR